VTKQSNCRTSSRKPLFFLAFIFFARFKRPVEGRLRANFYNVPEKCGGFRGSLASLVLFSSQPMALGRKPAFGIRCGKMCGRYIPSGTRIANESGVDG
jgi:hypothetical protein